MERIYQRFDLDLNSIKEWEKHVEQKKHDIPKIVDVFKQYLLKKGYEILESNDNHSGLCGSIIIGGELGKNIKSDFYRVAAFFKFPYKSGPYYLPNTNEKDQLEVLANSGQNQGNVR